MCHDVAILVKQTLRLMYSRVSSFQINAANVRMGNAKVEARSPSGQVHEMSISENDGAYTANFTPTEVGM